MLLVDRVVYVLAAEQFLFHLAPQRGRDSRVTPEVRERLVETLGDNCQLPRCVDDVRGALLHEQDVIGGPSVRVGRTGERAQGKRPAGAQPVSHAENRTEIGKVAVPHRQ